MVLRQGLVRRGANDQLLTRLATDVEGVGPLKVQVRYCSMLYVLCSLCYEKAGGGSILSNHTCEQLGLIGQDFPKIG